MRWKGPYDARWLRRWTIRLGIASWIILALPVLTVFALISVVGIPLAIVMMVTPTVFVVIAVANVVQRLLRRDGTGAVVASLAISLLLLAGVAKLANSGLDRRADEFVAGDFDALERPLRARSIGLVYLGFSLYSKRNNRCDEFCQRLLLSGSADRVLIADRKTGETTWTPETPGFAYRFEQRDTCPPAELTGNRYADSVDDAKADEAMRRVIASGRCLIEEPATLADTDAVIAYGRLQRGASDFDAGLSLTADTVTAHRASVHIRNAGQNDFVERYRWTGIRVERHFYIPIPTLVGGTELNMKAGYGRMLEKRNVRDFADEDVNPVRFAHDELGLDLAVPPTDSTVAIIERGLNESGPLQPALQKVIEDYFASLRDAKNLDEATRRFAFRMLADDRVVAPRESWTVVRASANAGDAVNAELADILFRKFVATDPSLRENHPSYLGYPASYLAIAIAMLPPRAVLAHRRELELMAHDPPHRRRAHRALPQLSAFGAGAVPTLLFLIDESIALRVTQASARSSGRMVDPEDWQDLYGSGLTGLCRLGSEASSALEPMMSRLRDGTLPIGLSHRDLELTTLLRLGADPAHLRARFVADATPKAREDFERRVERARRSDGCLH
jgi:hypothetical protein